MRALAVVATLAVAAAAWFGWTWVSAANDDGLEVARERDAVLAAVGDGLVALHTIDHRHADRDIARWIEVTTGELGDELARDRQLQLDRAAGTKTVASATLLEAAVTELDYEAGTARLVAVLDVRLGTEGEPPEPQRSRLTVGAERAGEVWKVSEVQAAGG
ncbi:hypothetical protein [Prauserella cavernicola]|uniref:Mce-associated membrane protein n=1 Tax=Prauserella cavernicola TaxID=2800127 RepID=A0A934QYA8_9PSEU|nr:hypothetical protein [Prauserella cavernicola]MBK1788372.1 hypothetical protein [Prauserella cavernicola]